MAALSINGTNYTVPEKRSRGWGNSFVSTLKALGARAMGVFHFGNSEVVGGSNPGYLFPGYRDSAIAGTEVQVRVPRAGYLFALTATLEAACDGFFVLRPRINGVADPQMSCTILEGQTVGASSGVPVSVAAGDRLSVSWEDQGGASLPSGVLMAQLWFVPGVDA